LPPLPTSSGARIVESKIDLVIDGGRKKSVSADLIRTTDRILTDDTSPRTYTALDLRKILPDLLRGKSITMVARDPEGMSTNTPPRQVLMEFHMPDPSPLISVCGEDRSIRGLKP